METVTALLTARKGRGKNMWMVNNRPLVSYPAEAAQKCKKIDQHIVSSDDDGVLDCADGYGFQKIHRHPDLSTAEALHVDVINDALEIIRPVGILVVLMGNTVHIKTEWIDACIDMLLDNHALTCAAPAYIDQDHHPIRARGYIEDGYMFPHIPSYGPQSSNRNDLSLNLFFCHNFWAIRLQDGKLPTRGIEPWPFMGERVRPLIVEDAFDVHTRDDLAKCEAWLKTECPKCGAKVNQTDRIHDGCVECTTAF